MFCNGHRESKEDKVTIHEASSSALQLLVDYAYMSKVTITEDNATELMEGASLSFFQVPPVRDACIKFLSDNLSIKNCMKVVILGGMLNSNLETDALSYAMKEFAAACKTPEFLDLTKDQLIKLISSDNVSAPEETVYMSVMKWINHDTRKRKKEMRELMELVRFPFMDKMYFIEKVQPDKTLCKCCPDIVLETQKYHVFPGEVQSPRTRPRRASGLREAVVVIAGIEELPRYLHAVASFDGSIYVIGGRGADDLATSTVYRFSPGDCQWHSASDMPNKDNAVELLKGASFFQFEPVKDACTTFLSDTLWITNCLERINVANMLMDHHLETNALSYVMKEFTAVNETL
ncbi:kelch-like protein 24 [Branchiostoma floridae]|uniref:Kelch-like protein 24 n=1 Tax=Branchiostoma floridae TaxID=7739 RepID=A0A9J7MN07_BRAFL|nr:kelch-like protein 24 [Branchiostoma floridae]